jgi:hypothetical protein
LILASSATNNHLPNHKWIALSTTYGILFLGTPHQGADMLASAKLLSINSNNLWLKHLSSNSEWLNDQLTYYNPISKDFHTIFLYEMMGTKLASNDCEIVSSKLF